MQVQAHRAVSVAGVLRVEGVHVPVRNCHVVLRRYFSFQAPAFCSDSERQLNQTAARKT